MWILNASRNKWSVLSAEDAAPNLLSQIPSHTMQYEIKCYVLLGLQAFVGNKHKFYLLIFTKVAHIYISGEAKGIVNDHQKKSFSK